MIWKGTFLLLVGQILALLSGYGMNVFLARYLGPEEYGSFGVVHSILLMTELCVIAGVPNALKKFIGMNPKISARLHRVLLPWQMGLGFVLGCLGFFLAPTISHMMKDESIVFILQIAFIDVVFFMDVTPVTIQV